MRRRTLVRGAVATAAAAGLLGGTGAASGPAAAPPVTLHRGGSTYGWWAVPGCRRERFGIVNGYAAGRDRIAVDLATMHAAGQRRLRIPVFHRHGPASGTFVDSRRGLPDTDAAHLAELLGVVRRTGFVGVQVALFPGKQNHPREWAEFDPALHAENLAMVRDVRDVVTASGLPYRMELSNELVPPPGRAPQLEHARRLWDAYTERHGAADTVGFSCIADVERVRMLPQVYRGTWPAAFDLHVYPGGGADEHDRFVAALVAARDAGVPRAQWMIGEAHHDDPVAAAHLARAIRETGVVVRHLYQWPLTRARACADVDVVPLRFDAYRAHGF